MAARRELERVAPEPARHVEHPRAGPQRERPLEEAGLGARLLGGRAGAPEVEEEAAEEALEPIVIDRAARRRSVVSRHGSGDPGSAMGSAGRRADGRADPRTRTGPRAPLRSERDPAPRSRRPGDPRKSRAHGSEER